MTNKEKIIEQLIFNIKNAPDSELPYMYSQCIDCGSCVFGKECEVIGETKCLEFIEKKLFEDKMKKTIAYATKEDHEESKIKKSPTGPHHT